MTLSNNADSVKEIRLAFDRSLGINSRYMTETERNTEGIGFVMRPDENGRLVRRETNGLFNVQKNEILYNPDAEESLFTNGHEITHWMKQNHPDVYISFRNFILNDRTDQSKQKIRNAAEPDIEEFIADRMGEILHDNTTLQLTSRKAEEFHAGFGAKFLTVLQEYARKVVEFLKLHPSLHNAEQYFKHYNLVREAAASALAELRKHSVKPQKTILSGLSHDDSKKYSVSRNVIGDKVSAALIFLHVDPNEIFIPLINFRGKTEQEAMAEAVKKFKDLGKSVLTHRETQYCFGILIIPMPPMIILRILLCGDCNTL